MIERERFLANKAEDFEAWLRARRSGVTATQVANSGTTAGFERVAAQFLTEFSEPDNPYMRFGRDWESHIADFCEAHFKVEPNEWLIAGSERHHLATPDGLSKNHKVIGEYKTTGKDWVKIEKLPIRYRRQVQWQLHVTGAEKAVVAWLVREEIEGVMVPATFEPAYGFLERDEEMIADLIKTADRLWKLVGEE